MLKIFLLSLLILPLLAEEKKQRSYDECCQEITLKIKQIQSRPLSEFEQACQIIQTLPEEDDDYSKKFTHDKTTLESFKVESLRQISEYDGMNLIQTVLMILLRKLDFIKTLGRYENNQLKFSKEELELVQSENNRYQKLKTYYVVPMIRFLDSKRVSLMSYDNNGTSIYDDMKTCDLIDLFNELTPHNSTEKVPVFTTREEFKNFTTHNHRDSAPTDVQRLVHFIVHNHIFMDSKSKTKHLTFLIGRSQQEYKKYRIMPAIKCLISQGFEEYWIKLYFEKMDTLEECHGQVLSLLCAHQPLFKPRLLFYQALRSGSLEYIQHLLTIRQLDPNIPNEERKVLLEDAIDVYSREPYKDIEILKAILKSSRINFNITALLDAAKKGHNTLIETILIRFPEKINAVDSRGISALHTAVSYNHPNTVETLIAYGADCNLKNYDGDTPVHEAACRSLTGVLKIFLKLSNVNPSLPNKFNKTALHQAAQFADEATVSLLLQFPNIQANAQDNNNQSALHIATRAKRHTIVRILANNPQVDTSLQDQANENNTALHIAAKHNDIPTGVALLGNSKTPFNDKKNNEGNTPFHIAAQHGHKDFFLFLIANHRSNRNLQNENGDTALHLATKKNHVELVRLILKGQYINPSIRNKSKETALDIAKRLKYKETAALIEEATVQKRC